MDVELLSGIETLTEACERCWRATGLPAKRVAAELGIDHKHWTRMFNPFDARNFPPDKIVPLMEFCKNTIPLEWLAFRMGYALHDKSLTAVLVAIRDALEKDGRAPVFRLCGCRVEAV